MIDKLAEKVEGLVFQVLFALVLFALSPLLFVSHVFVLAHPPNEEEQRHSARALWLTTPGTIAWLYLLYLITR